MGTHLCQVQSGQHWFVYVQTKVSTYSMYFLFIDFRVIVSLQWSVMEINKSIARRLYFFARHANVVLSYL